LFCLLQNTLVKTSIFFAAFFLLCYSCKKEQRTPCITIKYVDGFCYTHIYEITNPAFQHLGQDNWIRPRDGKRFDNVFVLENFCEDLSSTYSLHDSSFTVRLLADNEPKNKSCIVCQADYTNRPSTFLSLKPYTCDE
jgi:hypothetical protein